MLQEAFDTGIDVAHPTTGSNLNAQIKKITMAKNAHYFVKLVLVDTPVDRAIQQVQHRADAGGHDVERDAIIKSNAKSIANFESLKQYADEAIVV